MSSDGEDQLFSDNYEDDFIADNGPASDKKKSAFSIDSASRDGAAKKPAAASKIDLNAGFQLPLDDGFGDNNGFGDFGADLFGDSAFDKKKDGGPSLGGLGAAKGASDLKVADEKPTGAGKPGAPALLEVKAAAPADGSRRATASFGHLAKAPAAPKPAEPKKAGGRFDYLNFAKDNEPGSDSVREKESDQYDDDFEEPASKEGAEPGRLAPNDLVKSREERGFTLGRSDEQHGTAAMLAGGQEGSVFGTKQDAPKLGPPIGKSGNAGLGDGAQAPSQVNFTTSLGGQSGVNFEESPEKRGAIPHGGRDRTSDESLLHQASGRFGGLGALPPAPLGPSGAQPGNAASGFSKPKFSSINSNAQNKNYGQSKPFERPINQSAETAHHTIATTETNGNPRSGLATNILNPSSSDSTLIKAPVGSKPMIGGRKAEKPT